MPSADEDSSTSFSILMPFLSFVCLSAQARVYSPMFKNKHSCFVLNSKRKNISSSSIKSDINCKVFIEVPFCY